MDVIAGAIYEIIHLLSIRFEFDPKLNILMTFAEGLISFEGIMKHLDREGMQQYLGKPELIDAVGATTDLTPSQLRDIVSHLLNLMRDHVLGPTAIIAQDRLVVGMSRILAIISELDGGPEFGVFQTHEEGIEWLRGRRSA